MGAPASPSIDEVIADRYVLERPLGEGGMGTVYLARHRLTGRRVALKWVQTHDAVMRERLLREARAMALLSHPNVVGVLDAGEQGHAVFLVMEYVNGQNLRVHVAQRVLPPEQAVQLLMPALCGVAAAHQAGVLHRDLKPENLFVCLDADGSAFDTKVLDFGVSKQIGGEDTDTSLTGTGVIVGTPKFMAPEQIAASPTLDARTDIYALGVILYELLTGRLPYAATQLKSLLLEILRGDLPSPAQFQPALPAALCAVVMKALASEPEDRYADVASFARALEPFGGGARFEAPRKAHVSENIDLPFDVTLSARTDSGEVPVPAAAAATRNAGSTPAAGKRKPPTGNTLQLHGARTPKPNARQRAMAPDRSQPAVAAAAPSRARTSPVPDLPKRSSSLVLTALGIVLFAALVFGFLQISRMHRAAVAAPATPALPADKIVQPSQPIAQPAPRAASVPVQPSQSAPQPLQALVIPVQAPQLPVAHSRRHARAGQNAGATTAAPARPASDAPPAVRGRSGVYRAEDF